MELHALMAMVAAYWRVRNRKPLAQVTEHSVQADHCVVVHMSLKMSDPNNKYKFMQNCEHTFSSFLIIVLICRLICRLV